MRSMWRLLLISLALCGLAAAQNQVNPQNQIKWPMPECASGVYQPNTNTCVPPGTAANPAAPDSACQFNRGNIFGTDPTACQVNWTNHAMAFYTSSQKTSPTNVLHPDFGVGQPLGVPTLSGNLGCTGTPTATISAPTIAASASQATLALTCWGGNVLVTGIFPGGGYAPGATTITITGGGTSGIVATPTFPFTQGVADPMGIADSGSGLQQAFDWAAVHIQGLNWINVVIPAGTYLISHELYIPGQLHIVAAGPMATTIQVATNTQTGLFIKAASGTPVPMPNTWTTGGFLEGLTINGLNGASFTGSLIEGSAVGYKMTSVRMSQSGHYCLNWTGERTHFIAMEFDTCAQPILTSANETRWIDTDIASPGFATGSYAVSPRNSINGLLPGNGWTAAQQPQSINGNGAYATIVVSGGNTGSTPNGISPQTYDPTIVIPSAYATIAGNTVTAVTWLASGTGYTEAPFIFVPGCDFVYISPVMSGTSVTGATLLSGGSCQAASGTQQLWFNRSTQGVHYATIAGIPDLTAMNGTWQITQVINNCSALSGTFPHQTCATSSVSQYIVLVPSSATGSATMTGVTYKPTTLPEPNFAMVTGGAAVQWIGGSIKVAWAAGCIAGNGSFSTLITGLYCEGYPINGYPTINPSIQTGYNPPPTHLIAPVTGGAGTTVAVATTRWVRGFVNNPFDAGVNYNAPFYIYPIDYVHGSTACSTYVHTPLGNCVQRGQREVAGGFMAGDGLLHFLSRNQSGTTVPTADGPILWPADSVVDEPTQNSYGPFTVAASHFEGVGFSPTGNWAAFCDDTTQYICAETLSGGRQDGFNVVGASGGAGQPIRFLADEWWGVPSAANEAYGQGFIKIPSSGGAMSDGTGPVKGAGTIAETYNNVMSGQLITNAYPARVAVQFYDGTHVNGGFNSVDSSELIANLGQGQNEYFHQDVHSSYLDPTIGYNDGMGVANGSYDFDGMCHFDMPSAAGGHAHVRVCIYGGPAGIGTVVRFSVAFWNDTLQLYTNAFQCNSGNPTNATAVATCTTASGTTFTQNGPVKAGPFTLNAAAASSVANVLTATFVPGAVAAASCMDQNAIVTGIVATDLVTTIKPPSTLGNVSAVATTTGTGAITIHFCNPTAASVQPPNGTWTFAVLH